MLKAGVRLLGIRPEVVMAHIEVREVFIELVGFCAVTGGTEGRHSRGSIHYNGGALDYRANSIPDRGVRDTIVNRVRSALGYPNSDFDFILETDADDPQNDHFHLEYQPKLPY